MTLNLSSPGGPGTWPLVVALHGWKAPAYEPSLFFDPCQPLPCHFLAPRTDAGSWADEAGELTQVIADLAKTPEVDRRRIYLIGFSMGGAGTYQIANAYHTAFGGYFAALVRVAGQSETELNPEVCGQTAVWHHIGTKDTAERVRVAQDCFRNLRRFPHRRGTVATLRDHAGGCPRLTKVFTRDGIEQARLSLYRGLGHDDTAPFADPQLIPWLFSRSLGP